MTLEEARKEFPIGFRLKALEKSASLESKIRRITITGHGVEDETVYVEVEVRDTLPTHGIVAATKFDATMLVKLEVFAS